MRNRPFTLPENKPAEWRQGVDQALLPPRSGTLLPSIPHPVQPSLASPAPAGWWSTIWTATTAGWIDAWYSRVAVIARQAIFANIPVSTGSGQTSAIRLQIRTIGGSVLATSGSYNISNTARNWKFEWLHGLPLWSTIDVFLALQVNITAYSSGQVSVFLPYGGAMAQRVPLRATTDGLLPGGL